MSHVIKDANGSNQTFKSTPDSSELVPHVRVDNLPTGAASDAKLEEIRLLLASLNLNTDQVENILTLLGNYNDQVETLLTSIGSNVDSLESLLTQLGINTDQVETKLDEIKALVLTDTQLRATPVPVNLPTGTQVDGPAAQSALNIDLLTGVNNGWYDAAAFQSGTVQVIGSASISAGQIIFEQTNDNTSNTGIPLLASEVNLVNANPQNAAFAIAANANRIFRFGVNARYVRLRISTAFTGGTVRAIGFFSDFPYSSPITNVQQSTAANLVVTANPGNTANTTAWLVTDVPGSGQGHSTHYLAVNAANSTMAALVKTGATNVGDCVVSNNGAAAVYACIFNKSSAPVPGTDTPVRKVRVGPGATVDVVQIAKGMRLSAGFAVAVVTGVPTLNAGTITNADEVIISASYT